MQQKSWYRKRSYPHFDSPLSYEDALAYVSDPSNVIHHPFLPFVAFELSMRRFRREPKIRPIKYASNIDTYIFSFYAHILSEKYEVLLEETGLSQSVLAYRSGIGDNITFAKMAFDSICSLAPCTAIGFDIAHFFDSIDHKHLKRQWSKLLGEDILPEDHYAVFRAITRYSYVDREECYQRLEYSRKQREENRLLCDIHQFRNVIKGRSSGLPSLVETNTKTFGIPQGSSISAILANIYMFEFDLNMHNFMTEIGGVFIRYSDDILCVCPPGYEDQVKQKVKHHLSELGDQLELQDDKTTSSRFQSNEDGEVELHDEDDAFQYLGFLFDGQEMLIRSQTISRFWRKAVHAVRKADDDARDAVLNLRNSRIFRRKIYRRFSHLGRSNFLTYARRAAKSMANEDENWKQQPAWRQVRRHWLRLQKEINTTNS